MISANRDLVKMLMEKIEQMEAQNKFLTMQLADRGCLSEHSALLEAQMISRPWEYESGSKLLRLACQVACHKNSHGHHLITRLFDKDGRTIKEFDYWITDYLMGDEAGIFSMVDVLHKKFLIELLNNHEANNKEKV